MILSVCMKAKYLWNSIIFSQNKTAVFFIFKFRQKLLLSKYESIIGSAPS